MRIIRFHGIAVFGAYSVYNRNTALVGIRSVAAGVDCSCYIGFIAILPCVFRTFRSKPHIIALLHHERLIVPACTVGRNHCRCGIKRPLKSCILSVVFIDSRRNSAGSKCRGHFFSKPIDLAFAECSVQNPADSITQGG